MSIWPVYILKFYLDKGFNIHTENKMV